MLDRPCLGTAGHCRSDAGHCLSLGSPCVAVIRHCSTRVRHWGPLIGPGAPDRRHDAGTAGSYAAVAERQLTSGGVYRTSFDRRTRNIGDCGTRAGVRGADAGHQAAHDRARNTRGAERRYCCAPCRHRSAGHRQGLAVDRPDLAARRHRCAAHRQGLAARRHRGAAHRQGLAARRHRGAAHRQGWAVRPQGCAVRSRGGVVRGDRVAARPHAHLQRRHFAVTRIELRAAGASARAPDHRIHHSHIY
jgi:hypothetical protein